MNISVRKMLWADLCFASHAEDRHHSAWCPASTLSLDVNRSGRLFGQSGGSFPRKYVSIWTVHSLSLFDVSFILCSAYKQYKCSKSQPFCYWRRWDNNWPSPYRQSLSSAVIHCYKFRKGMALILHWAGLEKTHGKLRQKKIYIFWLQTKKCLILLWVTEDVPLCSQFSMSAHTHSSFQNCTWMLCEVSLALKRNERESCPRHIRDNQII